MKVGLVLEGGGMRGMYTAGVLDSFLDNDIDINCIIGVSAGALFGVNYASKQRGRALNYNTKYIKHPMYMSLKSLIKTGNMVNKEFAYYVLPRRLDIFDQEEFSKSNIDYYATVTNVDSCEAEYIKIDNVFEQTEILRASSALPFISNIVEVNDKRYLDGGIADSIPIEKMLTMGCDKIIVVLTRPYGYKKEKKKNKLLYKIAKQKYDKLADIIDSRPDNYNATLENIYKLRDNKEIFVIQPSRDIKIKRLEKDVARIKEIYNLGLTDSNNIIDELKKYLNSSNN
ncbi:patatin family protein [Gemella sp. GH3]|uniref:patatin-like phospholipase family protein n=1 Tax=unclassified Gemella TaxID=2624949 RepID=UPI0015CFAF58|nr:MULTISPECIES: patatin family protein [unclassified Gemella]MBF0713801.1 patatin family protein [Gemella sp. GH3.1]NYS50753.1 patatin family protein [Gemella sp. GH3]